MPTVHPQVHKTCDLMPLISVASTENDDIRELTKSVVTALIDGEFFTTHMAFAARPATNSPSTTCSFPTNAPSIATMPATAIPNVMTRHPVAPNPAAI
jgi:hypothetical protein